MAKEIELKLALSPHHVGALLQHPLFQQAETQADGRRAMRNCYYDTVDQRLQAARSALRIRQMDQCYLQTLKTRGRSEAGLSHRNEWEWQIPSPELDFDLLTETAWHTTLKNPPAKNDLIPVFNTDFERQLWQYKSLNSQGEPVEIEIALDQGEIWVELDGERRRDPISELELELKRGQPADLFALAIPLARAVPLQICDISKAERGYRLYAPAQYRVQLERPQLTPQTRLESACTALLQFELQSWPRHLEAWQFSHRWEHGADALESLRNIQALRERFADIIPPDPQDELGMLVNKLVEQLRSLLSWRRCSKLLGPPGAEWTRHAADQARNRLEVLTQTKEAGLIALLLGAELSQQLWRTRWNAQQRQQADQPLQPHS